MGQHLNFGSRTIKSLTGLKASAIASGAAGNLTLTGVATDDELLSVTNITDQVDLTSEFAITAANTINNTGGTATTADTLLVLWFDRS